MDQIITPRSCLVVVVVKGLVVVVVKGLEISQQVLESRGRVSIRSSRFRSDLHETGRHRQELGKSVIRAFRGVIREERTMSNEL